MEIIRTAALFPNLRRYAQRIHGIRRTMSPLSIHCSYRALARFQRRLRVLPRAATFAAQLVQPVVRHIVIVPSGSARSIPLIPGEGFGPIATENEEPVPTGGGKGEGGPGQI